jgi:hypothetical protein
VAAVLVNTAMSTFDPAALVRVAGRHPKLRIIVSGGEDAVAGRILPAGVVHAALPRPYSPEQLLRTVRLALETA